LNFFADSKKILGMVLKTVFTERFHNKILNLGSLGFVQITIFLHQYWGYLSKNMGNLSEKESDKIDTLL